MTRVHLITVVGGSVDVLPHMLRHYRTLGLSSLQVHVILSHADDPVLQQVTAHAAELDTTIASVTIGEWQQIQSRLYLAPREAARDDWFVLADHDELHVYGRDLQELIELCERRHWDHVTGCFVDRVRADGRIGVVDRDRPLGDQFPLGGWIGYPLLRADPRKVVLVKGAVPLLAGQHLALGGTACPPEECFAQVHHFKWVSGLAERLAARASALNRQGRWHWKESQRFVNYYHAHGGRFDLTDERLLVASCDPCYQRWEDVKRIALSLDAATRRVVDAMRRQLV